jgi:thiosulfate/3-mercaptopyruvate sulfurtransferase
MRHSVSIPFNALLATHEMTSPGAQGTYTTLLGNNELRKALVNLLGQSGRNGEEVVDLILQGEQRVVASCGSGMTAAVIWLALQELGITQTVPLYDEVSHFRGCGLQFGDRSLEPQLARGYPHPLSGLALPYTKE